MSEKQWLILLRMWKDDLHITSMSFDSADGLLNVAYFDKGGNYHAVSFTIDSVMRTYE